MEFLSVFWPVVSGFFGSMKLREKVFFGGCVLMGLIVSVWLPVQGCSLKNARFALAEALRENQALRIKDRVKVLKGEKEKLLLDLYAQHTKNHGELWKSKASLYAIEAILAKLGSIEGKIKNIDARRKIFERKIDKMSPEQQIEYIRQQLNGKKEKETQDGGQ